jgi:sterol desaturase/sphingolipid hydroxylase (fatty acid hydroxylase superfamily)
VPWIRIESGAYWCVAVATFLGVAIWESFRAKQDLSVATGQRWRNHALVLLLSTVISAGLLRVSPVVMAAAVANNRVGLLNKPWLPFVVRCIFAVLLLDLVKYSMHRAFHSVPMLWRVHQVHHSDPDFDVSTAFRVHPFELLVVQGTYLAAVALLAPPLGAVVFAELAAGFESFFGHANARLPEWVETRLRLVFLTPDLHRIHHSEEVSEQTKNLGETFPWWDRLFGTYVPAPAAGQVGLITGLKGYQDAGSMSLGFMLRQPFMAERQGDTLQGTPVA